MCSAALQRGRGHLYGRPGDDGDDVKTACAQIVRNAQSTPALNASKTKIDTMQVQYFSSSLVDETVQAWLRPYIANRLG